MYNADSFYDFHILVSWNTDPSLPLFSSSSYQSLVVEMSRFCIRKPPSGFLCFILHFFFPLFSFASEQVLLLISLIWYLEIVRLVSHLKVLLSCVVCPGKREKPSLYGMVVISSGAGEVREGRRRGTLPFPRNSMKFREKGRGEVSSVSIALISPIKLCFSFRQRFFSTTSKKLSLIFISVWILL